MAEQADWISRRHVKDINVLEISGGEIEVSSTLSVTMSIWNQLGKLRHKPFRLAVDGERLGDDQAVCRMSSDRIEHMAPPTSCDSLSERNHAGALRRKSRRPPDRAANRARQGSARTLLYTTASCRI